MPYDQKTLDRLRMQLLERRHALVQSTQRGARELEGLKNAERLPELEEGAQNATAEYVLTQLNDGQRREVAQIDAALSRLEAGTYGLCVDCEEEIPVERLKALPYALRDAECASRAEAREMGARELPTL
ncbi:TraR/DksA family transcriptional regulator [Vulgatibacter sp.]|uniref:TraR/DksA family transcriptional regulator n=1 Tax=Vulgatibacter sp. TaxID=1971226 RepID=UPI00356A1040